MMIKVLIADDHHLFRDGITRLLQDAPGIELAGSATNGEQAVELARQKRPDVILMDVNMPGMGGLEATRRIHAAQPDTQILMLTISEQSEDLFEAIRLGARGYLLKNVSTQELLAAIRQVSSGEAPIAPRMAGKLVDAFATMPMERPAEHLAEKIEILTEREVDVLKLVARGFSNREVAEELVISERTVAAHVRGILGKLHVANRTQAALYALREGLASLDE